MEFQTEFLGSHFTTFSRAVPRNMCAAMLSLALMSSVVLYRVLSRFLARLVERKCYTYNPKTRTSHCSWQLFIQGHGSGNLSMHELDVQNIVMRHIWINGYQPWSLWSFFPRATWARLSRAKLQRPRRATSEARGGVLVPSQAKNILIFVNYLSQLLLWFIPCLSVWPS